MQMSRLMRYMLRFRGQRLFVMHKIPKQKERVSKPYFIVDGEIIPDRVGKVIITESGG